MDADLSRVQDRVADALTQVLVNPLLNGEFVTVSFDTGLTQTVNHKLSRKPLGWIITDKTATADIYRSDWDSRTLTLVSSSNTIVTLYIF